MHVVRARIFALLAALLLLPSGAAAARTEYYCRMMGGIVASCCCNDEARSQGSKHGQEAREADCCERMWPAARSASLGKREAVQEVASAEALSGVGRSFEARPAASSAAACIESTQAPLAVGPPLFLVHCALLS
jgi:hypothetical protein